MPASDRLLLDASLLLSADGNAWLVEDPLALDEIVISRALAGALRGEGEVGLSRLIAPEDENELPQRMERLSFLLPMLETFSYIDADLPYAEAQVRDALLDGDEPSREVLADEWTFLVSNSWMATKLHYPLDKFRDGGAGILEFGRRVRDEMISVVVPQANVPAALRRGFLSAARRRVASSPCPLPLLGRFQYRL
jgi:hypothetical protein